MAEPTLRETTEKRIEEIHATRPDDEGTETVALQTIRSIETLLALTEVQIQILLSIDEELAGLREECNRE